MFCLRTTKFKFLMYVGSQNKCKIVITLWLLNVLCVIRLVITRNMFSNYGRITYVTRHEKIGLMWTQNLITFLYFKLV